MDTYIWVLIAFTASIIFLLWANKVDKGSVNRLYSLYVLNLLVSRSDMEVKTRYTIYFITTTIVIIRCSMVIKNKYKLKKGIAPGKEVIKK